MDEKNIKSKEVYEALNMVRRDMLDSIERHLGRNLMTGSEVVLYTLKVLQADAEHLGKVMQLWNINDEV